MNIVIVLIIGILIGILIPNYHFVFLKMKQISTDIKHCINRKRNFKYINIKSAYDNTVQKAYFYATTQTNKMPLIVSLHSWSLDYREHDPLADLFRHKDWNYIHPDFRGANNSPEAMMSNAVIQDIDDAIAYAIDHGNVDTERMVVVGASGGGMATLGVYLRSSWKFKLCMAWCPISDLEAWYYQSKFANTKYWNDIAVSANSSNDILDVTEVLNRSPLYTPPRNRDRLEIYAGINDGYTGSVSILHSILFYNKMAEYFKLKEGVITDKEIINLVTRSIKDNDITEYIGDRKLLYKKSCSKAGIFIFDGTHEILSNYAYSRIKQVCSGIKER
jgi:hypothetical protein